MIRAALLLLALALVAYLVRPRRRSPEYCRGFDDGYAWRESEDGLQADDYPWRVLARGAA